MSVVDTGSMAGGTDPPGSGSALAKVDEPSPPRPPLTGTEALKLVGGLVVVCSGLFVLLIIAAVAMLLVKGTTSEVVAIATSAFGVIGTVVGAYFGLKIGTDGTQTAVAGLKDEAAKAQAFAAHVPKEAAATAIADAQSLARSGSSVAPGSGSSRGGAP
ncbi:MAG: hypothetical protein M3N47_09395 [Chloroflexota bacterium]|nr:hypothetical protein [Chloroflexota bacterium]